MQYVEVVEGDFTRRGVVVSATALSGYIQTAQKNKTALYRSYYVYGPEILDHLRLTGSMSDYGGPLYLDRILFDIDIGSRSQEATLETARSFVSILIDEYGVPQEVIQPFFSGTGFHIVIPEVFGFEPGPALPAKVKQALTRHFPLADNIYDGARIIRVENTINPKSGLYKIPFSVEDFMEMELHDMKDSATEPWGTLCPVAETTVKIQPSAMIMDSPSSKEVPIETGATAMVTCMQKLWDTVPEQGSRHESILRMSSAYRRGGLPESATVALMKTWLGGNSEEVERLVSDVYTKGYMYSCNDHVMAKHCDPKCMFYKKKNYSIDILTPEQMELSLARFVRRDFSQVSINLQQMYPSLAHSHFIMPGEFVLTYGDTGLNKTAWVQNICLALKHLRILFLSLEVNERLIYRRFMQIAHGLTREQLWQHYKGSWESLAEPMAHINVITTLPTLDDVERTIHHYSPQLVVVDTADCVRVPGVSDVLDELGRRFAEIAKRKDIIIWAIHHISKAAAVDYETGKSRPLHKHSGKGASTLEQQADKVYGIEGASEGVIRSIRTLKARDESFFRLSLRLNPATFQLVPEERQYTTPTSTQKIQ